MPLSSLHGCIRSLIEVPSFRQGKVVVLIEGSEPFFAEKIIMHKKRQQGRTKTKYQKYVFDRIITCHY